jgi:hypothetical protein
MLRKYNPVLPNENSKLSPEEASHSSCRTNLRPSKSKYRNASTRAAHVQKVRDGIRLAV